MLGIYVFVYAIAHFFTYAFFELQLDWHLLTSELVKRPYIVVGMVALILLMALTVTSLSVLRRKMGKQWQRLHYLRYFTFSLAALFLVTKNILASAYFLLANWAYYYAWKDNAHCR